MIDIGVNLTSAAFKADREAVIDRAALAGVAVLIVIGNSVPSSLAGLELARTRPGMLYATAGVHPHNAKTCDASTLDALRGLAAAEEIVAIGECGLDYDRDFSPRPVQDHWFEAQLELAADLAMPVFLHERRAGEPFTRILARHRQRLPRAVLHCFTGSAAELDRCLALDLHIGITGWICDERRGQHLLELVKRIPSDRLMIETDAPYLYPRTLRGTQPGGRAGSKHERNEPAFLPHVLAAVARALDLPEEAVASTTTRTARDFFGIGA